MARKTIRIKCDKDLKLKNIDEMQDFQGDLKELTDEAKEKLKNSIVEKGFRLPIFMWRNKILDGHQRIEAVTSLIEDGYKLKNNALPYVDVPAKNAQEAKELILLISSRYAEITYEGLSQFLGEAGINLDDINMSINLPEIEMPDIDSLNTDFTLPDGDKPPFQQITFTLADKQAEFVKEQLTEAVQDNPVETFNNENRNGNALYRVFKEWAEQRT